MNLRSKLIIIVALIEGPVFAYICIKHPDRIVDVGVPVLFFFAFLFGMIIWKTSPNNDSSSPE